MRWHGAGARQREGPEMRGWFAALLCAVAIAACGGGAASPPATTAVPATSTGLGGLQQSFTTVINRVTPQVVQISNPHGLGSGVVFDGKGDIVTNAHVVAGGGPLEVTDSRGRTYHATLVGSFTPDDLAVVHASGASLPAATFADSGALAVGDIIVAIGNPLGLRSSVTQGIVSALGRTVDEPGGNAWRERARDRLRDPQLAGDRYRRPARRARARGRVASRVPGRRPRDGVDRRRGGRLGPAGFARRRRGDRRGRRDHAARQAVHLESGGRRQRAGHGGARPDRRRPHHQTRRVADHGARDAREIPQPEGMT